MRMAVAAAALLLIPSAALASAAMQQLLATGSEAVPSIPAVGIAVDASNWPIAADSSHGVDRNALDLLLAQAKQEHSDAIVILSDGRLVASEGIVDRQIMAMSATKSIAGLAIGCLIADGKLKSLDQPVSDFFPEWKAGEKNEITVRMLMNHTSGIDAKARGVTAALKSGQMYPPGAAFAYSNSAVDLLAGIIQSAAGKPAELYIAEKIFHPLDIKDVSWIKDPDGYPLVAGELSIRPVDLAKIGQMVLDGGMWNGQRVIQSDWIAQSFEPSQRFDAGYGMLWWRDAEFQKFALTSELLDAWKKAGIPSDFIEPLAPLIGKSMLGPELWKAVSNVYKESHPDWMDKLQEALHATRLEMGETVELGPVEGVSARGWLGQYLVVDLKHRIVGVRMRRSRQSDYDNPFAVADGFYNFPSMVHQLISEKSKLNQLQ